MDLRNKNNRAQLEYTLEAQTNDELDLKLLKAYLKATEKYGNTKVLKYQALKLKYEALITVPTTIEKTMSPYQLYASNSPLWTVELSANQIESFLDIEKNKGKLSKTMFERTYAYETNQTDIDFDSLYPTTITNLMKGN